MEHPIFRQKTFAKRGETAQATGNAPPDRLGHRCLNRRAVPIPVNPLVRSLSRSGFQSAFPRYLLGVPLGKPRAVVGVTADGRFRRKEHQAGLKRPVSLDLATHRRTPPAKSEEIAGRSHKTKQSVTRLNSENNPRGHLYARLSPALDPLAMSLMTIWFFFGVRRENYTRGLLLVDFAKADINTKRQTYQAINSYSVLTNVSHADFPIRSSFPNAACRPQPS